MAVRWKAPQAPRPDHTLSPARRPDAYPLLDIHYQ